MTIEQIIKEQIEQVDVTDLVQSEVRRLIQSDIQSEIKKVTKEEIQKIVKSEIEITMKNPISTDDGWGKKETFLNFEEMFKKLFKENLDSKYEVKRLFSDYITSETKKLVEAKTKDIAKVLHDIVLKEADEKK